MNVEPGAQGNPEISRGPRVAYLGGRWGSPTQPVCSVLRRQKNVLGFASPLGKKHWRAGAWGVPKLQHAHPEEEVGDVTTDKAKRSQGSYLQARRWREWSCPEKTIHNTAETISTESTPSENCLNQGECGPRPAHLWHFNNAVKTPQFLPSLLVVPTPEELGPRRKKNVPQNRSAHTHNYQQLRWREDTC